MRDLSREEVTYTVTYLKRLADSRGIGQTELAQMSGVPQPTICKLFKRQMEHPTPVTSERLLEPLGMGLADVLNEPEARPSELRGYFATPLTGIAQDERKNRELASVIKRVRDTATEFGNPSFEIYWPGDVTHPLRNPDLTAEQVYLTDRSRASTYDFLVLLCLDPSYGVGQENEIATQAGVPAIRLLGNGISRMLRGSFLRAVDVEISGDLSAGVRIDTTKLAAAFREIRQTCFNHRALYCGMNGDEFGERLRKLIADRSDDYCAFAEKLGISLPYLHVLMNESPAVSNPSMRLLKRMARLLCVRLAYLTGESPESDAIWEQSMGTLHAWVRKNPGILDAALVQTVKEDWIEDYKRDRGRPAMSSARDTSGAMEENDWDREYKKQLKELEKNARGGKLFGS